MVFEKLKDLMVETVNCDADEIELESNLKDDLDIDSLDGMELNMAIEEEFGISIDDDDIAGFVTVKDIVDYVEKKMA